MQITQICRRVAILGHPAIATLRPARLVFLTRRSVAIAGCAGLDPLDSPWQ